MLGKVYSIQGQEVRTAEMSDDVFGIPVNKDLIWSAINNELANKRVGTADTKTRAEVHGTNKRPYAQKGTGRARQGDVKSPLYVGGGTVFGPHPRDYSYSINKKAKRHALKSILSLKAKDESFKIVEDFSIESGKTKDLASLLAKLLPEKPKKAKTARTVIILKDNDAMVKRAGRNIPWLHFLSFNRLRAHDLFYGRNIIIMETALKNLNEFYMDK